ncbi:MAG TPA: tetratricopeptide repeat protein [Myxococcota bacterium]|nr:tetratricopeptide repeat protein [Myxococcota bacterium]
MEPSPRERFAALAKSPDSQMDVALGALLVAAEAYPQLDIAAQLAELDALARAAAPSLRAATTPLARMKALLEFVAGQGFRGNRDDYYDPRNSFLNEVLARRTGIPITLALVCTEIARRIDLPVYGVSFPGHFLVKYVGGDEEIADSEIVADPFSRATLSEDDVRERFKLAMGPATRFDARWLRVATPREILVRLLGNLKQIYVQRKEPEQALSCCDRILMLVPDAPLELRDRGLVYQQLECFGAALGDLERFLALAPQEPSADAIRDTLVELRAQAARVN